MNSASEILKPKEQPRPISESPAASGEWSGRGPALRAVRRGLLLLILAFAAWNSLNYVTGLPPSPDGGVFASGSMHLLQDKVLYRDVWDHKPPMVYVINSFALALGGLSMDSIRMVERLFAVVGVVFCFLVVSRVFGKESLAFVAALFFLFYFYQEPIFQGGNLTEEYASILLLVAIFFTVAAKDSPGKKAAIYSAAAGFWFSSAALTKEPYLYSALVWFLYLTLRKEGTWRLALPGAGAFLVGAAVPPLLFLLYLGVHRALGDWLEVVSYNLFYCAFFQRPGSFLARIQSNLSISTTFVFGLAWTWAALALAGMVSAWVPSTLRRYKYFPIAALLAMILDFRATMLCGKQLGHYYLQLVPSFILIGACGGACLLDLSRGLRKHREIVLGIFLALLLMQDRIEVWQFGRRLVQPSSRAPVSVISQYIRKHTTEGDLLWATSSHNSRYYLETGRRSPTKFFYVADHLFIEPDKGLSWIVQIQSDLEKNPPKYIIYLDHNVSFMRTSGLLDWISAHYTRTGMREEGRQLFVRSSNAPRSDVTKQTR